MPQPDPPFEFDPVDGRDIVGARIQIRNTGDGLSEAVTVDPAESDETPQRVTIAELGRITRSQPACVRVVHVLRSGAPPYVPWSDALFPVASVDHLLARRSGLTDHLQNDVADLACLAVGSDAAISGGGLSERPVPAQTVGPFVEQRTEPCHRGTGRSLRTSSRLRLGHLGVSFADVERGRDVHSAPGHSHPRSLHEGGRRRHG